MGGELDWIRLFSPVKFEHYERQAAESMVCVRVCVCACVRECVWKYVSACVYSGGGLVICIEGMWGHLCGQSIHFHMSEKKEELEEKGEELEEKGEELEEKEEEESREVG